MTVDQLLEGAGLALLASVSVGMWTLRVAAAAAGWRLVAAVIAAFEAVLFVVVFGSVVSSVDDPVTVASYALGVAGGTLMGIAAGDRLAAMHAHVPLREGPSGGSQGVEEFRVADRAEPGSVTESGAPFAFAAEPCATCALIDVLATPHPPGVAVPGTARVRGDV